MWEIVLVFISLYLVVSVFKSGTEDDAYFILSGLPLLVLAWIASTHEEMGVSVQSAFAVCVMFVLDAVINTPKAVYFIREGLYQ